MKTRELKKRYSHRDGSFVPIKKMHNTSANGKAEQTNKTHKAMKEKKKKEKTGKQQQTGHSPLMWSLRFLKRVRICFT
jgi:hypothetical protein